ESGVQRTYGRRDQIDPLNFCTAAADPGFSNDSGPVRHHRFESYILGRRRIDAPGNLEDLRRGLHGIRKITHHLRQRHQEEIAEAVALQATPGFETVLK